MSGLMDSDTYEHTLAQLAVTASTAHDMPLDAFIEAVEAFHADDLIVNPALGHEQHDKVVGLLRMAMMLREFQRVVREVMAVAS